MTALRHLPRRPHPSTPRARNGAPAPRLASTEENRLGQEILLLRLTGAIVPVTLLAWLLGTPRDPGLALGSQLIIPVYVALAGGAAWRRRRLLANPWFRALLFALQIMLVGLQVGAYDGPGTPIWLAFAPVLLVGALRWQLRGALIALGLFAADRLATVATLSHITGARAADELTLELSVMALLGVSFGVVFRELESSRRHLWRSLSRLATSTGVLSAVLDNVGEAILTVDDAGLVSSANGAAGDLFASESGRLVGGPLERLIDAPGLGIDDLMRGGSRSRQHEATGRRPDGSGFTAEVMATLLLGDGGTTRILVVRDVSELRARTAALSYEARHDGLTGLPNRAHLRERLRDRLAQARPTGSPFSLLFVDLDGFKTVNDTHGHHAGDLLLQAAAERLRDRLRESDLVARLGGDEFAVLPGPGSAPAAPQRIAEKVVDALRQPFVVEGYHIQIGASVGIAVFPEHGADAEELLRVADAAMYAAKRSARGWSVAPAPSPGGRRSATAGCAGLHPGAGGGTARQGGLAAPPPDQAARTAISAAGPARQAGSGAPPGRLRGER